MKELVCSHCGASDWQTIDGFKVCSYCGTNYQLEKEDIPMKNSTISLEDDVANLLKKCRNEPHNAKKYANLILDIDPANTEALKYLK